MRYLSIALCACVSLFFYACTANTSEIPAPEQREGSALAGNSTNTNASLSVQLGTDKALQDFIKDRFIVILKDGQGVSTARAIAKTLKTAPTTNYEWGLIGFAGKLTPAELQRLMLDPRVKYVEADQIVHACAQQLPWGVDRIDAEKNTGPRGQGVGIAIVDTGIEMLHPDLTPVVHGINAIDWFTSAADDNGHGTHCAGIAAARDNGIGYVGVAPKATLVAVKVLSAGGGGTASWVALGLTYCGRAQSWNNIKVASMSLAGGGFSQACYDACEYCKSKGVTCVVAAGNNASNAAGFWPASFDNCITVSAIDSSDRFASFSNFGSVVDVTAPGVAVPSTYLGGGYATLSGTSMACPHASGCVALWCDNHPNDGFNEVYSMFQTYGEYKNWPGDPDGISEPLVDAQQL